MKYIGICLDCGRTVQSLNNDGQCPACEMWEQEQRDARLEKEVCDE